MQSHVEHQIITFTYRKILYFQLEWKSPKLIWTISKPFYTIKTGHYLPILLPQSIDSLV